MLEEAHLSTSQPQVVEDESPAGEAMKVYFSWVRMGVQKLTRLMENYGNTWMQEKRLFHLGRERDHLRHSYQKMG